MPYPDVLAIDSVSLKKRDHYLISLYRKNIWQPKWVLDNEQTQRSGVSKQRLP